MNVRVSLRAVLVERPLLADSVEKVGYAFHGRKVRA
jgi:hypothetical protein